MKNQRILAILVNLIKKNQGRSLSKNWSGQSLSRISDSWNNTQLSMNQSRCY